MNSNHQDHYLKVKDYVLNLGLNIIKENLEHQLLIVTDENRGIKNLLIDCEYPILVVEQAIFEVKHESAHVFKRLLQINRHLVHGALVLDEEGKKVIYRDTLELDNLDFNELEATINSLGLALIEYANELIEFSK